MGEKFGTMEKMVDNKKIIIIGAGVAGLAASYYLKSKGITSYVYDMHSVPGGLSRSFKIGDLYFDYGGHCTFAKDKEIREILESGIEYHNSVADGYNYKNGKWIKHPVQNNLKLLDTDEKINIIKSFIEREDNKNPNNYQEWLYSVYGIYYSDNYPRLYTQKYWTVEPQLLETKWVGPRMYKSNIDEILRGAFEEETPNVHYSNGIRYPKSGGFDMFLKNMVRNSNIKYNSCVTKIDTMNKIVFFSDGKYVEYDYIISTIPLPEYQNILAGIDEEVVIAMKNLDYTTLHLVSIGLKRNNHIPSNCFYIYDQNILPSRVYSTTQMAGRKEGNVSLQAEVYTSKYKAINLSEEEIKRQCINQLMEMGVFNREDILFEDIRVEKYANIMFTHGIYDNREIVHTYLDEQDIVYAGRFGEWDYLWTDQGMASGTKAAKKVESRING